MQDVDVMVFLGFAFCRVYGGDDIELSVCVSQHILKERDEGEVREWDELLRLLIYDVSSPCHSFRHCRGRSSNVGSWLAKRCL